MILAAVCMYVCARRLLESCYRTCFACLNFSDSQSSLANGHSMDRLEHLVANTAVCLVGVKLFRVSHIWRSGVHRLYTLPRHTQWNNHLKRNLNYYYYTAREWLKVITFLVDQLHHIKNCQRNLNALLKKKKKKKRERESKLS